jgi:hypothetical protein
VSHRIAMTRFDRDFFATQIVWEIRKIPVPSVRDDVLLLSVVEGQPKRCRRKKRCVVLTAEVRRIASRR